MSTGGAGRSQSAALFNVSKKQEESSEQPNSKGKRSDTNPTDLLDKISNFNFKRIERAIKINEEVT